MQKIHALTSTRTLLCAALVASPAALAGKATIASSDGSSAEFEYAGDMLRMSSPQGGGYMLIRDKTMYMVSMQDGTPMVISASAMMKGIGQAMPQVGASAFTSEFISMEDTGRNETVAGIKGDVYEFSYRDENGKTITEELVVSDDDRALEFRDALFSMSTVAEAISTPDAVEQGREMQERFENMNLGVLRYGAEMKVTAISGETIQAERFELPAEPMNLQGLGDMLGNMSRQAAPAGSGGEAAASEAPAEKKGGLLSTMMGALGGKANDTADEGADESDQEGDGKDNAIGKAFNKLFGKGK